MSDAKDFLVEIGTEELPPKALKRLMQSFADGVSNGADKASLAHGDVHAYASPRRLAVLIEMLSARQPDQAQKQKGPPVRIAFDEQGEPTRAAIAFAEKCGVAIDALDREKTSDGEWLVHASVAHGRPAAELMPEIIADALSQLPIPRRMRWGAYDDEFVRPVHWLLMLHGGKVIPCEILGVSSGNRTRGHRFQGSGEFVIHSASAYLETLKDKGHVIADFTERRESIVKAVAQAAKDAGGAPLGDDDLYDEVAALTEWPVPVTGRFDEQFLELPREVIIATLTSHQRYFPVCDKKGNLLPAFVTLANIDSTEPARVREGNERVVRPRLADAQFFWQTDRQTPLASRIDALKNVVYQKGLGTLYDRSLRLTSIATTIGELLGQDTSNLSRSAALAKCDLLTGMVGEFPELQGAMGAYYARASGEPESVAVAIGEQYLPRFAGDRLPESPGGRALSLADKLDTLAGIFVSGKRPSGNRDPFGLRRAALGLVRIIIEGRLDLDLSKIVAAAVKVQPGAKDDAGTDTADLSAFIIDRLRGYFLDRTPDASVEVFEAVRVREPASLVDFFDRLVAVSEFASLPEASSLSAANKRTANILRQAAYTGDTAADTGLFSDEAEQALFSAMEAASNDVTPLVERREYSGALKRLAELRAPVDSFFDDVMVLTDDDAVRMNRLSLLKALRALFLDVADISHLTQARD